jgi:glycosyltransferase involved in cell wall biosynthesis
MPEIEINENKKTFDIIFFARISKNKGIEDLINAMVKVKKYIPDVSLKVAGNTNKNYLNYLHKLVENNDLKDNIEFVGFLPTRLDVMNLASNARICALPTYNDIRPGTVVESMNVGVPVVAYNVGAIPEINKKEKCISLVKVGDIKGLSKAIIEILTDNELRKTLSKNGKDYIQRTFNNKVEMDKLVTAYNDIIKNFEKN